MDSTDQILEQIKAAGQAEDESIAIGTTALQLAALDHPGIDITPYLKHLDQLADDARERFSILRRGMSESELRSLIEAHTEPRLLGLLGEPRVNVLLLNLDLDGAQRGG